MTTLANDYFDKEAGINLPLDKADEELVKNYRKGIEKLSEDQRHLYFNNIIRGRGTCGFTNTSQVDYLINTDVKNRYRVTVKTRWTRGADRGESQRVFVMEAGGTTRLGCQDSGVIPVAYYTRSIEGETVISS